MLFERFVFVLCLMFNYAWFLLGCLHDTPWRFVPIACLLLTLLATIVVTLFQLQVIVKQRQLPQTDRWSTVLWCTAHCFICILFIADGTEWLNILVIMSIAGIFLTVVIAVIGICSCYVIIQNSHDWTPHVHLTCICFWVLVHFMSIRLPASDLQFITTVPVVAMGILRCVEHIEDGVSRWSFGEMLLWFICIALHACLDMQWMSKVFFFWTLTIVACLMVLMSGQLKTMLVLLSLPIGLCGMVCFIAFQKMRGYDTAASIQTMMMSYENATQPKDTRLPFEIDTHEEDFETPL